MKTPLLIQELTWEFRTWDEPDSQSQSTDFDEIIIDNLNLSLKNFLDLPATAIIGRQDMFLGQGWLVADGTPMDGSRTFYFDAARFTYDLAEKTKLDTIYISNMPNSDWWLKPINDRNKYVTQEEEQGAILYLTDKSNAICSSKVISCTRITILLTILLVNKPLISHSPYWKQSARRPRYTPLAAQFRLLLTITGITASKALCRQALPPRRLPWSLPITTPKLLWPLAQRPILNTASKTTLITSCMLVTNICQAMTRIQNA